MSLVTRKLIAKELYVNRWFMLMAAVVSVLSVAVVSLGQTAFNVGSLMWLTTIIAFGVMLAIYGIQQERKEHSLLFVLSLPISAADYVRAKIAGLLLCYGLPWLCGSAAAIILILVSPAVPDGLLPYVILLCVFLLANFSVVLCGAIHARSEAMVSAFIIITNMAVSLFMFTVTTAPGIKDFMDGPMPVWNQTFFNVLLVEIIVVIIGATLPLATAARRRDFI